MNDQIGSFFNFNYAEISSICQKFLPAYKKFGAREKHIKLRHIVCVTNSLKQRIKLTPPLPADRRLPSPPRHFQD